MSESSDSNKLLYANKISEEESNNKENENIINCLEQKPTKIPEENEELKRVLAEKEEIIKKQQLKINEQYNELKENEKKLKEQKLKMSEMQEVIKSQNEIIEEQEEKIKEQNAKIEKDDFIINIYHKQHFLEIKNIFMKEGSQSGVNVIEQIEKYNSDHN